MANSEKLTAQPKTDAEWESRARERFRAKDYDAAREALENALLANPSNPVALALMGEIYFEHGDLRQAIGHYVLAIAANPEVPAYKERFIELAGLTPFYRHNEAMQAALEECLKTPGLDCARAQILWYTLLTTQPAFKKIYKFSNFGSRVSFNVKSFDKADYRPLLDPFFLNGLKKIAVYHPVFEEFLTCLRKRLLESLDAPKPRFARADVVSIAGALAHYAFYTEFIFDTTDEEERAVAALRGKLEMDEAAMKDAATAAVYACYAPLHALSSSAKIAAFHANDDISGVIGVQIHDHLALLKRRGAVEAVTPIEDAVSKKVQEQYEEFPYPRWKAYSKEIADEQAEGGLRGKKAEILVAGCGTGREAIQHAAVFPDAGVLGVDLSRMSLAYAIGRAEELGFKNVTFRQADILKLGALDKKFDYISSSGVLHHMDKPLEGWRVLCGLLKAGGLMRIALYSKIARRHIVEAHKAIASGGFSGTARGMRQFRRRSPELLDRTAMQDLYNRGDYFHLSMYRDLLFHVQEHRFDIPEIAQMLQTLGLEFVKFGGIPPGVLAAYRKDYPDDPEAKNLAHWHAFEQENPDTFSNMYHFWCRKRA